MAPSKPPSQTYQGETEKGFMLVKAVGLIRRLIITRQISPIRKLNNELISGPPVCLPNFVFKTACTGSIAPISNVEIMMIYLMNFFYEVSLKRIENIQTLFVR